jgi:hypothetical protein
MFYGEIHWQLLGTAALMAVLAAMLVIWIDNHILR